jgi:orotidine-5'-phosphate decarboxylase
MKPEQIIVALDGLDREEAILLAWTLSSSVWGFKVNDLLLSYGLDIIRDLKCLGKVFVDPKLYDIPKTVANSVFCLSEAGADLITVHASGGKEMMKTAVENAGKAKILAVTMLTSLEDSDVQDIYHRPIDEIVWDLAHLAYDSNVHGIVCSSLEVKMLNHLNFMKVVPGIRLGAIDNDDQKRVGNGDGADLFVIGRAITESPDPLEALHKIIRGGYNATNNQ